jgi:hypothetical protein
METLIGFAVGYFVGTRQGRDGLRRTRESLEAIRNSPEARQLLAGGLTVATSAVKQVLSGGAGAALTGAIDAITRKTTQATPDPADRRAA